MQEIIKFIITYKSEIITLLGIIASIVILCVKKKPVKVIDSIKDTILQSIPYYVNKAEQEFGSGHGSEKLQYVVNAILHELVTLEPNIDVCFYTGLIIESVEKVLSTPQKK